MGRPTVGRLIFTPFEQYLVPWQVYTFATAKILPIKEMQSKTTSEVYLTIQCAVEILLYT